MSTPLPWEPGGEAWDQLTLGSVTFTGKVSIKGDAIKKKLDKRRARGADGGRVTDQGNELRDLKVTLTGWTEEHRDQLDAIVAQLSPPAQASDTRYALWIDHPSLAQAVPPLYQVLVESVGLLDMGEGGLFSQELSLVEYREPPARNVTHAPRPAPAPVQNASVDPEVQRVFDSNPIPSPSASGTSPASGV